MKLLNPLRRNRCHLCRVDFFHSLSFLLFSTISRYFSHFYLLLSLVNNGCGSCGRCFLFELYGLFRRTGEYRTPKPLFPSQVKWACAACNRRKIQCLLCLSHGLAVLGATAQWLRCIVHLCRSFLGFQVLLLELHIALEIYVVPFSNAKVVGSFRMARLNMFRRKVGA